MEVINKIIEKLKSKWLRQTSLTILLITIIILIFIGSSLFVKGLNLTDIDLTEEKLYSLTETSKEQISKIPETDKIEIYLFNYIENSSVVDLIKQYAKLSSSISYEIVSVEERKDLATKYEITENSSCILIVSGEKHRLIDSYDLYTYDYSTGNSIDIAEQRLTNGIISISSIGKTTVAYMLKGHGEYSTEQALASFKTFIEVENYELKNLDLLVEEKIPEECEVLIISSPEKDFATTEVDKIKTYINNGGSILWMNDPLSAKSDLKNSKTILDLYGVELHQDGVILEQDLTRMVMQNPYIILPKISIAGPTSKLATDGIVMFLDSSKLTFLDDEKLTELGVTKTELLTTSETAFYRTDLTQSAITPNSNEKPETMVIGALLEKKINDEKTSKLIIYANNAFATDSQIKVSAQVIPAIYFYNNVDLVINSVKYMAENEDQITIRKAIQTTSYTATGSQDIIIRCIIFGVPVLIIICGIIVWQLRRRKK